MDVGRHPGVAALSAASPDGVRERHAAKRDLERRAFAQRDRGRACRQLFENTRVARPPASATRNVISERRSVNTTCTAELLSCSERHRTIEQILSLVHDGLQDPASESVPRRAAARPGKPVDLEGPVRRDLGTGCPAVAAGRVPTGRSLTRSGRRRCTLSVRRTEWSLARSHRSGGRNQSYEARIHSVRLGGRWRPVGRVGWSMRSATPWRSRRRGRRIGRASSPRASSRRDGHRVALFVTGRRHAGENLGRLLAERTANLGPPIQMCDALPRNLPKPLAVFVDHCLPASAMTASSLAAVTPVLSRGPLPRATSGRRAVARRRQTPG